jgi:hypothetical protein
MLIQVLLVIGGLVEDSDGYDSTLVEDSDGYDSTIGFNPIIFNPIIFNPIIFNLCRKLSAFLQA